MDKKIKLLTHCDLDGYGCEVLAKLAFGENVDTWICNYHNIDKNLLKCLEDEHYDEFHITDISCSMETAKKVNAVKTKPMYLFDHHETATDLNCYDWCKVEINNTDNIQTCGTELYYHWLLEAGYLNVSKELDTTIRTFVEMVRDYDTWRWHELNRIKCKQLNDLIG